MELPVLEEKETDYRILTMKENATKFVVGDLQIEIATVTNPDGSELSCGCMESLIREESKKLVEAAYN